MACAPSGPLQTDEVAGVTAMAAPMACVPNGPTTVTLPPPAPPPPPPPPPVPVAMPPPPYVLTVVVQLAVTQVICVADPPLSTNSI
jgi:hypothetical protein